ncbi:MAG TPA: crosslink repair DNA glycosylase YcaQ family protein [Streptosporangiaceae bacterium]
MPNATTSPTAPSPISGTAAVPLSLDDARRLTLRAQGFIGASARKGGVPAMLRRLGGVQLDTISVLARSHELVAYARLGPVPRARIERAYWPPAHPQTFEYWAHAACLLPIEEWPWYAFRRRWFRNRGMRWHQVSERACQEVRAKLAAEGPLTATQLGGAKGGGPWWDWSEVKVAAEWLLDIGELVCVRRDGWRRIYDLPERVLPPELLAADPDDAACVSHLVGVATRALGAVTHNDLVDYHRLQSVLSAQPSRNGYLDDAAQAAGLVPVTFPGPRSAVPGWADPAALAAEEEAGRERHRVTLLSPFDSLVWDRKRTRRLFGFEHSLEAYVPKAKRVHGYFVMPLLAGGRLVGRVDPAREGRTLVARKLTLDRPSAAEPMARALKEAATWVNCDYVELEQVEPASATERLRALLK